VSILFIQAVIWFSLFLKRGAVPVAIVATLAIVVLAELATTALNTTLPRSFFNYLSQFDTLPPFRVLLSVVGSLIIVAFLHVHSLRRLERLAGEG
jgi:hypothetical protein